MKRIVRLTAIAALWAQLVWAHGPGRHVMGTVERVATNTLVVRTTDDETLEIRTTAETTVRREETAARLEDLRVGERVVVDASPQDDGLVATSIHLAPKPAE
jgi:Domain of unknown function (DUF5666)